jgi:membrane-associated phospholipid phosphatase
LYLGAHFPLDVIAGAGLGLFIGGVLNLVFGVPGHSPGTARASGLTWHGSRDLVNAAFLSLCPDPHFL